MNILKNTLYYISSLLAMILLIEFNYLDELLFGIYISLGIIISIRFYYSMSEYALKPGTIQEGIHSKIQNLELDKVQLNFYKTLITRILLSFKYGLSFPITFIQNEFSKNKFSEPQKNNSYNFLHPKENHFFALVLWFSLIVFYIYWFGGLSNGFYATAFSCILLIVQLSYLISLLVMPDLLISSYITSLHNVKLNIFVFAVTSYLILLLNCYTLFNSGVGINIQNLVEFNSKFIGFKKIRLYLYGVIDYISFKDILLSTIGLIFSATVITSAKKILTRKRSSDEIFSIAYNLNLIGEFQQSLDWFEKFEGEKPPLVWKIICFNFFGLGDLINAIKLYDRALMQEEGDIYSKDYKFIRLLADSKVMFIPSNYRSQLICVWYTNSDELLFLAAYILLSFDEKELITIEYLVEKYPEKRNRKNIELLINFWKELRVYQSKVTPCVLKGKSEIVQFLNCYIGCIHNTLTYIDEPSENNYEEFSTYLEQMAKIFVSNTYQSTQYLYFLISFALRMIIEEKRKDLSTMYSKYYDIIAKKIKDDKREDLLLVFSMEDSIQTIFRNVE